MTGAPGSRRELATTYSGHPTSEENLMQSPQRRPAAIFFTILVAVVAIAALLYVLVKSDSAEDVPEGKTAAVVFDSLIRDKGFNASAYDGADRFAREYRGSFQAILIEDKKNAHQTLRRLAQQGFDPIIAVSFELAPLLSRVASEFPDTRFVIAESNVDLPNVQSIHYEEHEGSFLVGVLAALVTRTERFGFIGGLDIPLTRRFQCGFQQGVQFVNPKAHVETDFVGTWADPQTARKIANEQFAHGAEVIYAAAGKSGLGALAAAAGAGKLSIGVDSNQNYLHPGSVLTSMVKRIDTALYKSLVDAQTGKWKPGRRVYGLAEDGVGWTLDLHNRALISDLNARLVNHVRSEIIQGDLTVHDYTVDGRCPRPQASIAETLAVFSAAAATDEETPAPIHVQFGAYIKRLSDFRFAEHGYRATFSVWFVHKSPHYDPASDSRLANAREFSVRGVKREILDDLVWDTFEYNAHFHQDWDIRDYPFDRQQLRIVLESAGFSSSALNFHPDSFGSRVDPRLALDGWTIRDLRVESDEANYLTDYGNPRPRAERFDARDNIIISIDIKRQGVRLFLTSFIGFFVSTILIVLVLIIGVLRLLIDHADLRTRIGLCVGALFGAVGNAYIVARALPYTTAYSLTDSLQATTFGFIALATIVTVISEPLLQAKRYNLVRLLNGLALLLLVVIHFGVNASLIFNSINA